MVGGFIKNKPLRVYSLPFFLISAFAVALSATFLFLNEESDNAIRTVLSEVHGCEYLKPLQAFYQELLLREVNRIRATHGAALSSDIGATHEQAIERALIDLQTADYRYHLSPKITALISGLKRQWEEREPQRAELLVRGTKGLYSQIADDSKLVLDPVSDSYHLQDILFSVLTDTAFRIGQIPSFFDAATSDEHFRSALSLCTANLRQNAASIRMDLSKISESSFTDEDLRPERPEPGRLLDQIENLAHRLEILMGQPIPDASVLTGELEEALRSTFWLGDSTADLLKNILRRRLVELETKKRIHFWVVFLMAALTLLGSFFLAKATRKQRAAEDSLHESEESFRFFIDGVRDYSVFMTDMEAHVTRWNSGAEAMYGWREDEIIGKPVMVFYTSRDRGLEKMAEKLRVAKAKGHLEFETWRKRKDGTLFYGSVLVTMLKGPDGAPYGFGTITYDITGKLHLEKEVLEAREREQERLGRELHDGLAQQLAGISYSSEQLIRKLEQKELPEAQMAVKIGELVDRAVEQARDLARGIYPTESIRNGLIAALGDLCAAAQKRYDAVCEFKCEEPVVLKNTLVESHLYLIAQEAVQNAIKHGRARRIRVSLERFEDQIELHIEDDGLGMQSEVREGPGAGTRIMSYRAKVIGATLEIQSKPSGGTLVLCTLSTAALILQPLLGR